MTHVLFEENLVCYYYRVYCVLVCCDLQYPGYGKHSVYRFGPHALNAPMSERGDI